MFFLVEHKLINSWLIIHYIEVIIFLREASSTTLAITFLQMKWNKRSVSIWKVSYLIRTYFHTNPAMTSKITKDSREQKMIMTVVDGNEPIFLYSASETCTKTISTIFISHCR